MKKNILVVDDNQMMLTFLSNLLEREGHHVLTAEDGLSALNILATFTPEILFIDLIMPKIGGDKLCQIVRKMKHMENAYLVVVSAAASELELDYQSFGADACIAKGPFNTMAEHVLESIKNADSPLKTDGAKAIVGVNGVFERQMTKELLSRNQHLESVLESIEEGIIEVFAGKIVYTNSAAVTLFGISQETILASSLPDLFQGPEKPRMEKLLLPENDQPVTIGLNNPVELNDRQVVVKSMMMKGEESSSIILITDVTEQKRLELQLQHAQKMEAIGTMASGVAHNFRNTLAGILVNSQVMQLSRHDDVELLEMVNRIETSVRRGTQLIDGLMQFSRKQLKKEFIKINLCTVIREIYQLIEDAFDKKINISVQMPESLYIMGDPSGLGLAVMNLCTNSRDAMPQGGKLTIEAKQEGDTAVLVISDTGCGMTKENVERCFDPFFTTKEVGKGTGLGLSTAYGIVKNHDGRIYVYSEPLKGTIFKLYFPIALTDKTEKETLPIEVKTGKGETVLVVDDDAELLESMPKLLKGLGYRAMTASNGTTALQTYRASRPDVVLMDRNMPGMDGMDCIQKIKDDDPNAVIAVISGYGENGPNGIHDNKRKLINGYLTKPVDLNALSALLADLVKKGDSPAA